MNIEQLERMEKYYLPDDELSAYDIEFIIANARGIRHLISPYHFHGLETYYDIRDYCAIYASCNSINSFGSIYFSARYRCIKYEVKERITNSVHYIDFKKKPFDPHGDITSHTVTVDSMVFKLKDPMAYNFLIVLLKWSDNGFHSGQFPVVNPIDADLIFISEEIQKQYGLDIDIDSAIPFSVGYAEFYYLDQYHVIPKDPMGHLGTGLCFYVNDSSKGNVSIGSIKPYGPSPYIWCFDSPYNKSYTGSSYKQNIWLSMSKNTRILGKAKSLTIFVSLNNEADEYYVLRLFTLRDYYFVATWLIVALSFFSISSFDRYHAVHKYWPSCPFLQTDNAHFKLSKDDYDAKAKNYIEKIKPSFNLTMNILNDYTKLRSDDYNASHQSLSDDFVSECISIVIQLTGSANKLFESHAPDFINALAGTDFHAFSELTSISEKTNLRLQSDVSGVIQTVGLFDTMLIGSNKISYPLSQGIIEIYKSIADAIYDITESKGMKNVFDAWIDAHQRLVNAINSCKRIDSSSTDAENGPQVSAVNTLSNSGVENSFDSNELNAKSALCLDNTKPRQSETMEQLNNLIGLSAIKEDVISLISLVKMQQLRKRRGLKSVPLSLHLVFTGNPGTGKTTVARILGQLYKEIGILKTGQLVEVDRSDLVAGYVGQTATKTQAKIKEALGGILFIDEAYTLAKDGNDFGQEAIDTILKEMEDHRDEFIVIVAGYDEPMQKFINSNPGLKSRFNKYFHFSDYSADELVKIFQALLNKYDYRITDDAMETVITTIIDMKNRNNPLFANAREIRNYFEHIITRQALRISSISSSEDDAILEIRKEDLQ